MLSHVQEGSAGRIWITLVFFLGRTVTNLLPLSFFLSSILAGGSGRKERSERRTGRQARGSDVVGNGLGL